MAQIMRQNTQVSEFLDILFCCVYGTYGDKNTQVSVILNLYRSMNTHLDKIMILRRVSHVSCLYWLVIHTNFDKHLTGVRIIRVAW